MARKTRCSLIVESGEPREVHHYALLFGYGAAALNPYLAFETLADQARHEYLRKADGPIDGKTAEKLYIKAINKGVLKVMSKMGISTLHSYHGAQIFEAVGLNKEFVDDYFTHTASRIEGVGIDVIAEVDVVMLLRMQFERQREALFPTVREYTARYGLTEPRAERLKPDALIMHPGPMNRGVEVAAAVADGPASLVTEQVANGVAVRMAVLYTLLGSGAPIA